MKEKQRRLNDTEKQKLFSLFETGDYTATQLSKVFPVSDVAIRGLLNRKGYKLKTQSELKRKYPVDEFYFDKVDGEEKAYFLGLLYADGCNYPERNSVSISLQERDKAILEYFTKVIQPTKPLSIRKEKGNTKAQYLMTMQSKRLSLSLSSLGVIKSKTFTLTFPLWLEEELVRHFVRGYFDGDGWVGHRSISLVATEEFCLHLRLIIENRLGIKTYLRTRHPERGHNIRQLEVSGGRQARCFLDWIYQDSTVYLERKFLKYKDMLSAKSGS